MTNFTLALEKEMYSPEDTIKGIISVNLNRLIQVKQFEFFVKGIEQIDIRKKHSKTKIKSYQNNFFYKDLSSALISLKTQHEKTIFKLQPQIIEIPFEFTMLENTLESYEGKHASLLYVITFKVNLVKHRDIKIEKIVNVVNKLSKINGISKDVIFSDNKSKNEETAIKIDIEKQTILDNLGLIKGKIIVENEPKYKIRKIIISLKSIEDVKLAALSAFALLPDNILKPALRNKIIRPIHTEQITVIQTFEKTLLYNNEKTVPFDFSIPNMKSSFQATSFAFYWLIDVKIEPWTYDLHLTVQFGSVKDLDLETIITNTRRLSIKKKVIMIISTIVGIIFLVLETYFKTIS